MNPTESTQIIEVAGGDVAFARLLGLDHHPGFAQRVNNWKRRGIPARVILDHQLVIEQLRRKARAAA